MGEKHTLDLAKRIDALEAQIAKLLMARIADPQHFDALHKARLEAARKDLKWLKVAKYRAARFRTKST